MGWLDPYNSPEFGFAAFSESIGTVIMGRATYDQTLGFGVPWPNAGKRTIVFTSRPLGPGPVPEGVERWAGRDPRALAADLRAAGGKDVWICGGAKVVRQFLDLDLIDRIELFVIPVLLGDGLPLFERSGHDSRLRLEHAKPYSNGVVELVYRVDTSARRAL